MFSSKSSSNTPPAAPKTVDDLTIMRLEVAKAMFITRLGPNHGLSSQEIQAQFDAKRTPLVEEAIRMTQHLKNLGYEVVKA